MTASPITRTIEVDPDDLEKLVLLAHREIGLHATVDVCNCGYRCGEGQHDHHARIMVSEALAGRVLP